MVRYHKPAIPALGKLRQGDVQREASWDYIVKPCLKGEKKKNKGEAVVKLFGSVGKELASKA